MVVWFEWLKGRLFGGWIFGGLIFGGRVVQGELDMQAEQ